MTSIIIDQLPADVREKISKLKNINEEITIVNNEGVALFKIQLKERKKTSKLPLEDRITINGDLLESSSQLIDWGT